MNGILKIDSYLPRIMKAREEHQLLSKVQFVS